MKLERDFKNGYGSSGGMCWSIKKDDPSDGAIGAKWEDWTLRQ